MRLIELVVMRDKIFNHSICFHISTVNLCDDFVSLVNCKSNNKQDLEGKKLSFEIPFISHRKHNQSRMSFLRETSLMIPSLFLQIKYLRLAFTRKFYIDSHRRHNYLLCCLRFPLMLDRRGDFLIYEDVKNGQILKM